MACISSIREQKSTKINNNLPPESTNRSQNKLSVTERLKKLVIFKSRKRGQEKGRRLASIQELGEKVDINIFFGRLEEKGVLAKLRHEGTIIMYGVRSNQLQIILTRSVESSVRNTLLESSGYSQACLDYFIRYDFVKSFKFEQDSGFLCSNGHGLATIGFVIYDGKRHYGVTVNHGAHINPSQAFYDQTSKFCNKQIGGHFFSAFRVSPLANNNNNYNNNISLLNDIESDHRSRNISSASIRTKSLPLVSFTTAPGYVPVPMIEQEVFRSISQEHSMDFTVIELTESLVDYKESTIHFEPISEGTSLWIDTWNGPHECVVHSVSVAVQIDNNSCFTDMVLLRNNNSVQRGDSGCVYIRQNRLYLIHLGRITYELEERSKKFSFNVAVPLKNEWDLMKKAIICRKIKLGYLFALQIRRDLLTGVIPCQDHTAVLLASYIAQAELGDFIEDEYVDHTYLKTLRLLPNQTDDLEIKIMEHHREHIGQTPPDAEFNLLDTARKVELYGIKMHPAKDHEGVSLNLAVAHMGVLVFQGYTKINTFSWAKIRKLSFKRKKFLTKLHPEGYGYYKDTVEFYFDTRNECKNFWKKCIEHHAFFRCHSVKRLARNKTRVVSKGSSFRYCGRTQKQLTEFVRDHFVKRSTFERSASQRTMASVGKTPTPNTGTLNSKHEFLMHNTSSGSHTLERAHTIEDDGSPKRSDRARSTERPNEKKKSALEQLERTTKGASDDFNYEYYRLSYDDKIANSNRVNGVRKICAGTNDNDDGVSRGSYHLSVECSLDKRDSSLDALDDHARSESDVEELTVEKSDSNENVKKVQVVLEADSFDRGGEDEEELGKNKEAENNDEKELPEESKEGAEMKENITEESVSQEEQAENIDATQEGADDEEEALNEINANKIKDLLSETLIDSEHEEDEIKNETDVLNGNTNLDKNIAEEHLNEDIPYFLYKRSADRSRSVSREASTERPRMSREDKRLEMEQIKTSLKSNRTRRDQSPSLVIDYKSLPSKDSFSFVDDTVSPTEEKNLIDLMRIRDSGRHVTLPLAPVVVATQTLPVAESLDMANYDPPAPLLPSVPIVEESSEEQSLSDTHSSAPTVREIEEDEKSDKSEFMRCDTVAETVAKFLADERNLAPPYPPPPIPCLEEKEKEESEPEEIATAADLLSPSSSKLNTIPAIDDDEEEQRFSDCDVMTETVSSFLAKPLDLELPPPPPPPLLCDIDLDDDSFNSSPKRKKLVKFAGSSTDSSRTDLSERQRKGMSSASSDTSEKEAESSTSVSSPSDAYEKGILLSSGAPKASMEDLSGTTDSEDGIAAKNDLEDNNRQVTDVKLSLGFSESELETLVEDSSYREHQSNAGHPYMERSSSDEEEDTLGPLQSDGIEKKFEDLLEAQLAEDSSESDENPIADIEEAADILDADVFRNPYNVKGDQYDFEMSPIKTQGSIKSDAELFDSSSSDGEEVGRMENEENRDLLEALEKLDLPETVHEDDDRGMGEEFKAEVVDSSSAESDFVDVAQILREKNKSRSSAESDQHAESNTEN
ncbi:DgyrCDS5618 [Dimorphilus gyrociliatus]|uniref:DgyrCDS5618 n=1 Tax=Dimorphilus gyrociliatus TaxID=2664684 RepID=A0A7I8VMQ7_9ANNE|nr:DgyrCDS5618 [Dimorphilus gyrociliatus]